MKLAPEVQQAPLLCWSWPQHESPKSKTARTHAFSESTCDPYSWTGAYSRVNVEQSNLRGRVPSPQAHSLEGPSTPNIPAAITCQKITLNAFSLTSIKLSLSSVN